MKYMIVYEYQTKRNADCHTLQRANLQCLIFKMICDIQYNVNTMLTHYITNLVSMIFIQNDHSPDNCNIYNSKYKPPSKSKEENRKKGHRCKA